jgi:hypothetical protein
MVALAPDGEVTGTRRSCDRSHAERASCPIPANPARFIINKGREQSPARDLSRARRFFLMEAMQREGRA